MEPSETAPSAQWVSRMACPVCDVELKMAERQGIEIDYCPQCRGVWLDRGELDKIIERSIVALPPQTRAAARPDDNERDEPRRHRKKKKLGGLLGEIFDFD